MTIMIIVIMIIIFPAFVYDREENKLA